MTTVDTRLLFKTVNKIKADVSKMLESVEWELIEALETAKEEGRQEGIAEERRRQEITHFQHPEDRLGI